MIIRYDQNVDILYIRFKETPIVESDELAPLIIADYDAQGNIVGLEILEISQRNDKDWRFLCEFVPKT